MSRSHSQTASEATISTRYAAQEILSLILTPMCDSVTFSLLKYHLVTMVVYSFYSKCFFYNRISFRE